MAWSLTYAHAHLDDLFVEKLSPDDLYSYFSRGDLRQMERRTEEIRVKGRSDPVVEEFFRTIHGPVVAWDREHHAAFSLGASFFKHEYGTLRCFGGLLRARTTEEAAEAVAQLSHSVNFLVASRSGEIGYWLGARFPTYGEGIDARFPMPGTGEYDWTGFRDPESLPRRVNPREGYILSWNNKPAPSFNEPAAARWMWAKNHRVIQLERVFRERQAATGGKLALTDLLDMTHDVGLMGDGSPAVLLPFLLRAADQAGESLDPEQKQAVAYLRAWDHRFTDWSVALTLYSGWIDELEELLFPPPTESAEEQLLWRKVVTPTTLLHALEGDQSSVPLSHDYLGGRSSSQVCLQALVRALEKMRSVKADTSISHGSARGSQKGPVNQMNFRFTRQARLNIDPLPPLPYYRRGTYLFGAEMTPEVLTYSVVLPGESGDTKSPHFADQRDLAGWYMFKMVASSRQQLLGRPASGPDK
jgi:penicillin amidase